MGYRTPQVAAITGCTPRQIDYWVRIDFVTPTAHGAKGSGDWRLYTPEDVQLLAVIHLLNVAGLSLEHLQRVGVVPLLRNPLTDWNGVLLIDRQHAAVVTNSAEILAFIDDAIGPLSSLALEPVLHRVNEAMTANPPIGARPPATKAAPKKRQRRTAPVLIPGERRPTCIRSGCVRVAVERGWCALHLPDQQPIGARHA